MSAYYGDVLEEELKIRVGNDWFPAFDTAGIVGKIDFSVALKENAAAGASLWDDREYLLWAEAKQGTRHDIYESFVQLILTIGKARTYDTYLPPPFLGAFDAEKIAFIGYNAVMELFALSDFNWNVPPSNHDTREFRQVFSLVKETLKRDAYIYRFDKDGTELREFIRANFKLNKDGVTAVRIDKNNFTHIYQKWLKEVKPTIAIEWDEAKKEGVIDADFYLADVLSEENKTLKEKLFVLLRSDRYYYNITRKATGSLAFESIEFNDGQAAHNRFWRRYTRPPKEEYWDYIVNRRDLLVPQDIRERKGSFFTPGEWVELSQEYLAKELGEDWQDEYVVWDCAAGTGNLLAGLTNIYNIYASTLDRQDVKVMQDLIAGNHLNLLESHVFQFDFLNDGFDKLPASLREIINDEQKRRKLIIYINPPYAEAATARQVTKTSKNKGGVAVNNLINRKYKRDIKKAANELFALFLIRIYKELGDCIIANFSTIKVLTGRNFIDFRNVFRARLCRLFIIPANTFDNVNGRFPIGFYIWRTAETQNFKSIDADVYDRDGTSLAPKRIYNPDSRPGINSWYSKYYDKTATGIGVMNTRGNDFQNHNYIRITSTDNHNHTNIITAKNLIPTVVYLAVRQCIEATWMNDRDQFFAPRKSWADDTEFQSDCLAYTLFHRQNRITCREGVNHWIPFTESEVGAKDRFTSHFMSDFIRGKHASSASSSSDLFGTPEHNALLLPGPIAFSAEARALLDAGRELWRYYHSRPGAKANASYYDIRLRFQGVNEKGKMNAGSTDETYSRLLDALRTARDIVGEKIKDGVYRHGFLMD
ncbi:MAG: hypothetical protein LUC22_00425 [Prevotella sp.]|nr:hypothetical protein [Prevotella sp.]